MNHPTQKYLGPKGLVILIALLSAFVPLSTDLYLPALPGMSTYFNVGIEKINLTLTFFFIFYAAGTLIWGPLSDRYGRKPILLIGLSIYVAASGFCSLTDSLVGLIVCRILQATGGSAAGAVATAIVKDSYSGRQRESVLAIVSSMVTISPAVAPVLGAFLLKVMSWRGIFWSLAIIGAVALIGTLFFEESIEQRNSTRLFQSFARMGVVLQNMRFTALLIVFSIINIASMAFISGSTYIYQDFFHLSSQMYSLYFAVNALGLIAGPMIYLWLSRKFKREKIIQVCFGFSILSGLLILFFGQRQPWMLMLCVLPNSVAGSIVRPPASNLMLDQQKSDTGSVSSLMSCGGLLMSSVGMTLITLPWGNMVLTLGAMVLIIGTIVFAAWPFVFRFVSRESTEAEVAEI
jgi:DHA1 family bicyclomycin/chloramphenicol resistance-like MFS transporter